MDLTFSKADAEATDKPAFSNGAEYDSWTYYACSPCIHEETCPLLDVALLGKTPAQWTAARLHEYQCSERETKGKVQP